VGRAAPEREPTPRRERGATGSERADEHLDELDEQDELHIAKDANAREGGTGARGLVVLLLTRDGSHQLTVDNFVPDVAMLLTCFENVTC